MRGIFWCFLLMAAVFAPRAAAAKTLTVAVEEISYLPYHGFQNGNFVGFAQKLLAAWAEARGDSLSFEPISVKRHVEALAEPGIDLVWPDNPAWRIDEKAALGRPVRYSGIVISGLKGVLVLHREHPLSVAQVTALGTIIGFGNDMARLGIDTQDKQMIETRSLESLVEMLAANRVDGIFCDLHAAEYELRQQKQNVGFTLDFAAGSPRSESPYRLSTAARPDLIEDFDAWFARNTPTVERLTKEAFRAGGAS